MSGKGKGRGRKPAAAKAEVAEKDPLEIPADSTPASPPKAAKRKAGKKDEPATVEIVSPPKKTKLSEESPKVASPKAASPKAKSPKGKAAKKSPAAKAATNGTKRTGRGRPAKVVAPANDAESEEEVVPAKKGRGAKAAEVVESVEVEAKPAAKGKKAAAAKASPKKAPSSPKKAASPKAAAKKSPKKAAKKGKAGAKASLNINITDIVKPKKGKKGPEDNGDTVKDAVKMKKTEKPKEPKVAKGKKQPPKADKVVPIKKEEPVHEVDTPDEAPPAPTVSKKTAAATKNRKPLKVDDEQGEEPVDKKKSKKSSSKSTTDSAPPPATKANNFVTDYSSFTLEHSKEANLKISTWNVSGIRAWITKGGLDYVDKEKPDILCLQEIKCTEDALPAEAKIKGYHPYWLAKPGGRGGVAIYSKLMPYSITEGLDDEELDDEGRLLTAEYEKYYLVCAYVVNSGRKLVTLDKRMRWDKKFQAYVKKLDGKKPVIVCGDMNVSHLEIDLANPKTNRRNAGFTQEERDGMSKFLAMGFVDTFRHFYPDKEKAYTYWTYMMNCRAKNVGWRLDYFIVSERFMKHVVDNVIRSEVLGSDHCPVVLLLKL